MLEEYKKAAISEAVTGQIDIRTGRPYPAYKPSGIEWLGDIPAHWDVRRLKTVLDNVVARPSHTEGIDLFLAMENVESRTGRLIGLEKGVGFDSQSKHFRVGDILFGKLRPYLAKVARPNKEGVCVGEFLVLRCRPREERNCTLAYLEQMLRSAPFVAKANSSTFGARMPRTDWGFIGGVRIPFPPLPEQTAIAEHLGELISQIDAAIANTRRQIDLLQEYRTRIIADVVTGQVDVRDAAAQIEDGLEELA